MEEGSIVLRRKRAEMCRGVWERADEKRVPGRVGVGLGWLGRGRAHGGEFWDVGVGGSIEVGVPGMGVGRPLRGRALGRKGTGPCREESIVRRGAGPRRG